MIRAATLLVGLCVAGLGCEKDTKKPDPAPAATSAAVAAPSASAPPKPEAPWYAGTWSGSYDAKAYAIETKKGEGLRAWSDQDAAADATGSGKLTLTIDDGGTIGGSASGPLGDMVASGEVDEDMFRVQLSPKNGTPESFQGFFVAKREGEALKGKLQASSGDSLKVRDAPVELKKSK